MRILFLNLLFLMSLSVLAQDRYMSLRECNGDTLEYVRVNFTGDYIQKYINQPFGKFADDFELELYFVGKHVLSWNAPRETLAIKISYKKEHQFYLEGEFPLYCCFIEFHQPHPFINHFLEYKRNNKLNHDTAIREYFRRFIIKDMEFVLLLERKDAYINNPEKKFWIWKSIDFD